MTGGWQDPGALCEASLESDALRPAAQDLKAACLRAVSLEGLQPLNGEAETGLGARRSEHKHRSCVTQ